MITSIKFPAEKWKALPSPIDQPTAFAESIIKQYCSLGRWPDEPDGFVDFHLVSTKDDNIHGWVPGVYGRDCYLDISWSEPDANNDASVYIAMYVWTGEAICFEYEETKENDDA